jgi:hypothetical protein
MASGAVAILGLIIVLFGSFITARAVIITDDDAIKTAGQIGAAPFDLAIPTREQFLQQPAVRNLIKQSRSARNGLYLIFAGTAFQLLGAVLSLFPYH